MRCAQHLMKFHAGLCRSFQPPRGASSELILFDEHGSIIAGASHDRAFNNKSEPHAFMQTYRPVDKGFHGLPCQKGFAGSKQQSLAANIQALTDTESLQTESRPKPTAPNRQPQREAPATPAIGEPALRAPVVLFQWHLQFCFARRHDSLTCVRSALSFRTSMLLTPLQHLHRPLC